MSIAVRKTVGLGLNGEGIVMSKRRSRAEWIAVCEAFEGSGETTRAFAERRGVHQATLGWWLTKLRREGALGGRAKAFVEVVSAAPASVAGAVVRIGAVTIEFGAGVPAVSWVAELAARC
jgi:hypothetical protein